MILALDPGVQACGMAWFDSGRLCVAEYLPVQMLMKHGPVGGLLCEMPRVYPGSGQQKGDLNDLTRLAAIVGYAEGLLAAYSRIFATGSPHTHRIYPADWKGQVPKKIMTARILSKLSDGELAKIVRVGAKDHNTIDAIGIGLHYLGRLK